MAHPSQPNQENAAVKMVYALIAALAAGAVVGSVQSLAASSPAPVPEASATRAAVNAGDEAAPLPASSVLEGEVLETIDVAKYSYLRLGVRGSEDTWVAIPSAKLAVGDHARVRDAVEMTDFKSPSLDRTFHAVYFGVLEGGPRPHGSLPEAPAGASPRGPHASGADPHAGLAPGRGAAEAGADPHAHASKSDVVVGPLARAAGPNGKTVAEVIAQRDRLAGKTVRIHATVVKSTPGVLGKTWLHLRDGSGVGGDDDLTATTDATPAVGDTVVVEGVVALDRDVGAGYRFPTLVEEAKVSAP